jgi:hypothetical protein
LRIVFDGRSEATFALKGPLPGDLIWDDVAGTTFVVTSRERMTVLALALNNYRRAGNAYEQLVRFSETRGNLYIGNTRRYLTTHPIFATVSELPSSHVTIESRYLDGIQVGDWMQVDELGEPFWNSTSTRITKVDTQSGTITFSGDGALTTFSRKLLPAFFRQ